MRRLLSLSIATGLALGAGIASAQSRTVSTADMPKPGVSYISGPSVPVRRETVSTGTLPQPARLYVGGQVSVGGGGYQNQTNYGDGGSVAENGYYYGGGYPPGSGYGRDERGGRDNDHGHSGHDHDHDGHDGGGHDGDHDHNHGQNSGSLSLAAPLLAVEIMGRPAAPGSNSRPRSVSPTGITAAGMAGTMVITGILLRSRAAA